MALSPGTRLGVYEILSLLGVGGMGEVYRARDTTLNRDVAIKLLLASVANDPDRLARFSREAQVLASLNHPHIAQIYGLEDSGNTRAFVMELVEGPMLADRIARGALLVEHALPIAKQIVDAMDYAHERGVLHRDLKPANIKVTPEGQVKVLDFGLAKALGAQTPGSEQPSPDESPTITSAAFTQAGTILGTAAYMAPEQVRGKAVDKRADIWAFGCILYEMLTGTRAFASDTVPDTLAAVLNADPDWMKLPLSVSAPVRQLLRRCLARDPRERLRDIADARFLLETVQTAPIPVAVATQARGRILLLSGAAATAAAFFIGAWSSSRSTAPPLAGAVRRVTVQLPVVLPGSTSGGGPALAIASDGSAITFSGKGLGQNQLYIHRLSDSTTTTIRGPANPFSPVFSPDGAWVAFGVNGRSAPATIWRASANGGDADPFCSLAPAESVGVRGVSWSEDGRVVFGSTAGLFEASAVGGSCQLALSLDGKREARFLWPQVLPNGRGTLLTVSGVSDDADSASIVVVPAGTKERRVIVRDARAGRFTKSGHLLFARGHQIFAAPLDLDRLVTTAEPVMVVDGVASGQFGGPLLDISDSGDLVYVAGRDMGNRLVWVTRNGARSDAGAPRRSYVAPPVLSPDGRSVAVSIGTADHFLWLYSLSAGTMTPVTRQDTHVAVWSPDGRMVSFPMQGIAVTNRESTGEPEIVLKGQGVAAAWSPDGTTIMYNRRSADGGDELSALTLRDRTTQTIIRARERVLGAQFSPDGRWVAYASNESGRLEVYVTDFPAAQIKKQVSTDGGSAPVWARNGRELFYVSGTSMMTAAVRPGAVIQFDRPIRLFDGVQMPGPSTPYSVSPDGRFLFVEEGQPNTTDRSQLTLVINWINQLKRLVPTK